LTSNENDKKCGRGKYYLHFKIVIVTMEKQKKDELLTRIARHLMLQGSFSKGLGLLNGKMGIAIFFFYYSKYVKNTIYEDFGGELIEEIYEEINFNTPVGFAEGLCGIGWAIEYLIQNHFVSSGTEDIFEDFDKRILEMNVKNMRNTSLDEGLEGIARYVISRFQGKKTPYKMNFINKEFIADLIMGLSSFDHGKQFLINSLEKIIHDKKMDCLNEDDLKVHIGTLAFNENEPFMIYYPLGIENKGTTCLGLKLLLDSE
jgi:hypothetical protein